MDDTMQQQVDEIVALLVGAARVVALTGAGISTESGIPDFRGPQGVWTKDPTAERKSHIRVWTTDAEVRREAWQFRLARFREGWPDPNDGHRALVALAELGCLDLVVTQNIDGLHQAAGHDPDRVIDIHGTAREVSCLDCGRRLPTGEVLDRVADGDLDPHCAECGGLLKSATISFGQSLVHDDVVRAEAAAATCDVFLALGTSLSVHPVALLPAVAKRAGATVVIVNGEPTERDDLADVRVLGQLGPVLNAVVDGVRPHLTERPSSEPRARL